MLKKLLKYDMRSVSKLWWIGALISVVGAVAGAAFIRFFMYVIEHEAAVSDNFFIISSAILCLISAIFCIIAVSLSFVFTMVLVFVRFYKHFFTDEGYLTFTLPVKRSIHYLSKTINAAIWFALHFVVIVASLLLFALLVYPPEDGGFFINFELFAEIGRFFADAWYEVGLWLIVYITEVLLLAFVYLIFCIVQVQFCITFGSVIAKKAKLIVSIAIYYGFSTVLNIIWQFGTFFFRAFIYEGAITLMEDATVNESCTLYALIILTVTAIIAAVSAALYSATQYMIDRKLNLA